MKIEDYYVILQSFLGANDLINQGLLLMTASFEKDMFIRIAEAVIGFVALAIGGLIYIRYRSESLLMFDWFRSLGLTDFIEDFRNNGETSNMYGWIKFNLPAGLWLFAYMFVIDAVWGKDKNHVSTYFLYVLPLLAIVSEFMQLVGLLPGTFDIMDLLSYISAILLFVIIKKL